MLNNRALLDRQIRNLFVVDAESRLALVNEPDGGEPPLFYMGRCGDGCVAFVRAGTPEDVAAQLLKGAQEEPATEDFSTPPKVLKVAADAVRRLGKADVAVRRGPSYVAFNDPALSDDAITVIAAAGRRIHPELGEGWGADHLPELELAFGVEVNGQIVALCHSARLGAESAEAGVNTVEAFRQHGYAAAAVGAWVRAVRASGRMAFYSTDWENVASQGVARRLGLTLLGELSQVR